MNEGVITNKDLMYNHSIEGLFVGATTHTAQSLSRMVNFKSEETRQHSNKVLLFFNVNGFLRLELTTEQVNILKLKNYEYYDKLIKHSR